MWLHWTSSVLSRLPLGIYLVYAGAAINSWNLSLWMIHKSKEYECVFCYQSTCLLQSFFVCLLVFLCRSQQPSHDLHWPSDTSAERPAAWPPRPQTAPAETTQLQRRGGTLTHLHLSVYKYSENDGGVGPDRIRFSISCTPCSIRSYTAACSCWVAAFGPAPPLSGPVTLPPPGCRHQCDTDDDPATLFAFLYLLFPHAVAVHNHTARLQLFRSSAEHMSNNHIRQTQTYKPARRDCRWRSGASPASSPQTLPRHKSLKRQKRSLS